MATKVMIGVVKLFEKATRRGVITPQNPAGKEEVRDLYFEATDAQAVQFRVGQLVKFVQDDSGSRAREVAVLSEKY